MVKWVVYGFFFILLSSTAYEFLSWYFDEHDQKFFPLRVIHPNLMISMTFHKCLKYFILFYVPFLMYAFYLKVFKLPIISLGLIGLEYLVLGIGEYKFGLNYNQSAEYSDAIFVTCVMMFIILPWILVVVMTKVVQEVNRVEVVRRSLS